MNPLVIKTSRVAITVAIVVLATIAVFKVWVFYTESPWTRDAKFTADVVAISPDVSGLLSEVPVVDNQLVKKGQVLMVIDRQRYQQAVNQAEADVAYFQALVSEKEREATRRVRLGVKAMSQEEIEQSNSSLATVRYQLAKSVAVRDLAKLDLDRTSVLAPADGWVTNLNVHVGEFINRGQTTVALVKKGSFYILAYMEETKLNTIKQGDRVEITPLGSNRILSGTVDSISVGIHNSSSTPDSKGLATVDSNLEWVRLAQRVPVKILLEPSEQEYPYPAGTTATVVVTNKPGADKQSSPVMMLMHRLREFG